LTGAQHSPRCSKARPHGPGAPVPLPLDPDAEMPARPLGTRGRTDRAPVPAPLDASACRGATRRTCVGQPYRARIPRRRALQTPLVLHAFVAKAGSRPVYKIQLAVASSRVHRLATARLAAVPAQPPPPSYSPPSVRAQGLATTRDLP
jgi:hypothetical protein